MAQRTSVATMRASLPSSLLLATAAYLATTASAGAPAGSQEAGLPSQQAVLADGRKAAEYWRSKIPVENCAWTGATFVIGLMEYYKATVSGGVPDAAALAYTRRWADQWRYQICIGWREESGCVTLSPDTAYSAGPMWNVSGVRSVDDCCALADSQQRAGCWGFTYRAGRGSDGGICSLHTNDNLTQHEVGAVSGWVRQGYGFPPPPSPPWHGKPKQEGKLVNPHNANEQLCGAVYAELYKLDGKQNRTLLADTEAVLGAEMADPANSRSLWSWVDALHMGMSTYSRMGNLTGDNRYYEQQWRMFNYSALAGCPGNRSCVKQSSGCHGYCFWNSSDALFYRDDNYVQTEIFWARGNGWAMAALVSAIEYGYADPHHSVYVSIFTHLAARLAEIQSDDGAWRPSLLNATGYTVPETTGTANFAYGIAYGINAKLLPSKPYLVVVQKAWRWLSTVALQPSGYVSFCQPGGSHPVNMVNRYNGRSACWDNGVCANTSNFCVGQFLLAASQVSHLSATAR